MIRKRPPIKMNGWKVTLNYIILRVQCQLFWLLLINWNYHEICLPIIFCFTPKRGKLVSEDQNCHFFADRQNTAAVLSTFAAKKLSLSVVGDCF